MNALARLVPAFLFLCASIAFGADASSASTVRIAVIGDATTADLSALLTADLAKQPGLVLVEREALAKIGDERALREMAAKDGAALGRLLAADGLLFLSKDDTGCEARFTAVRLGLVLFDLAIDPKAQAPSELKQVAENLGGRIAGLVPKLGLQLGEAVPISLLGLHSDLGGTRANAVERALSLLLEKDLVAAPKLVVLERRHAGALALEHDLLAGADAQPASGLWWIDGTLALPDVSDGEIAAVLRLRSPVGAAPLSIQAKGPASDLPKLAAALALSVAKAAGGGTPAVPPGNRSEGEARQYLMEGLWAVRHGKREEALAAFDSAALLGEKASDLLAGRIDAQLKIGSGMDRKPGEGLDERADALLGALHDLDRYAREKGESRLEIMDAYHTGEGAGRFMTDRLFIDGSAVLRMLREKGSSRTDAFREALRTFAGFDPLHGQVPTSWRITDAVDEWAESPEEEVAYYRARCSSLPQGAYILKQRIHMDRFCARFLPQKEDREAVFFKMVDDMLQDPKTRLLALYQYSIHGEKEARQKQYQTYLDSLWEQRETLQAQDHLGCFLMLGFGNREALPPPADPKLIALLHYYLQTQKKWGDDPQDVWNPEFFPKEEAASLWNDLEACKARCVPNGGGGTPSYFGRLEDAYVRVFGEPPGAASKPLSVARTWYAGQGATDLFGVVAEASDGLWIANGDTKTDTVQRLRFEGDRVAASPLALPFSRVEGVVEMEKCLYVSGWSNDEMVLGRYDLAAGTWQTRPVAGLMHLFAVGGNLYFSITGEDWVIGRYDWDKNEKVILASSRRTPPQNQFDSKANLHIGTVFAGPGGKPCVRIERGAYDILEKPGEWPETFTLNNWYFSETIGGRTLFSGPGDPHEQSWAVAIVDPVKAIPEEWIGTPDPIRPYGLAVNDPVPPSHVAPEWSKQPLWPGKYPAGSYLLHGDDLFYFAHSRDGVDRFHLLWFRRGRLDPIRVPLEFSIDGQTKERLRPYEMNTVRPIIDKTDSFAAFANLTCVATSRGLFFKCAGAIVWFLPYADLDAYLADAKK
ncbi:MAG TPA: hypothetical protein VIM58_06040 [Candidatus Methylacidiphilales bacterium]